MKPHHKLIGALPVAEATRLRDEAQDSLTTVVDAPLEAERVALAEQERLRTETTERLDAATDSAEKKRLSLALFPIEQAIKSSKRKLLKIEEAAKPLRDKLEAAQKELARAIAHEQRNAIGVRAETLGEEAGAWFREFVPRLEALRANREAFDRQFREFAIDSAAHVFFEHAPLNRLVAFSPDWLSVMAEIEAGELRETAAKLRVEAVGAAQRQLTSARAEVAEWQQRLASAQAAQQPGSLIRGLTEAIAESTRAVTLAEQRLAAARKAAES